MVTVPPSLQHPDLVPLWQAARGRLDRYNLEHRGKIDAPDMSTAALLAVESLLGKKPGARIDLSQLEQALVCQGLGEDLHSALSLLGFEPSTRRASQRAAASARLESIDRVNAETASWPEDWVAQWAEWLFSSGQMARQDSQQAVALVRQVRQLLDQLKPSTENREGAISASPSRNEFAVRIAGSSHALDDGLPLERCARRAVWLQYARQLPYDSGRQVWNSAGIRTDQVSAPVLVWKLPLQSDSALGAITSAATESGVPIHLSQLALRQHPVVVTSHEPVLVVENPYLVEAAAERDASCCVVAANGNPSSAVTLLVDTLVNQSVEVRYHGDFDSAGLGICRRMMERGCTPWRMDCSDYLQALALAREMNIKLPEETQAAGSTPWDAQLQTEFDRLRQVVHEELLVDYLL